MIALTFALLTHHGFSMSQDIAVPIPERKVAGLLIITSDPVVPRKVGDGYTFSMPFQDLVKRFKSKRFMFKEWGKRSAIMIDLESGPIGFREHQCELAESLSKSLGQDLTVKIGALDKEVMNDLMTSLSHAPKFPDGFDPSNATISIESSVRFSMGGGPGAKDVSFDLFTQNTNTKTRDEALYQHPLRFLPETDADKTRAYTDQMSKSFESHDSLQFRMFGVASNNLPEGMEIASKLIDDLYKGLRLRQDRATHNLLAKLIPGGTSFGDHTTSVNQLPTAIRDQLSQSFAQSWMGLGFNSRADAESYLSSASNFQISTALYFRFCESPGDPASGIAKSFGNIQFDSISGGISP